MQRQHGREEVAPLVDSLRKGALSANALCDELLSGQPEKIRIQAETLNVDPGLLVTVLRLVLFPVLTPINAALLPLRQGAAWQHGYCPTCGSWPLLGEFRGLEQTRFLRCALCSGQWEFPRLQCPFCGTHDHSVLGYLHVDGDEAKGRAYTCDACHGYVKMLTTLTALTGPQLLVQEVASIHLDLAAAERGFLPQPHVEQS
jgi:FdhE protein